MLQFNQFNNNNHSRSHKTNNSKELLPEAVSEMMMEASKTSFQVYKLTRVVHTTSWIHMYQTHNSSNSLIHFSNKRRSSTNLLLRCKMVVRFLKIKRFLLSALTRFRLWNLLKLFLRFKETQIHFNKICNHSSNLNLSNRIVPT